MNRNLPAHEKERRKFWKYVCREELYFPSIRLEKHPIHVSAFSEYVNRRVGEWPIRGKEKTIDGWKKVEISGFFRIATNDNRSCYTTSSSGCAQYHWCSIHYKRFRAENSRNELRGVEIKKSKFRAIENMKEKEIRTLRRVIRSNLSFAYKLYDGLGKSKNIQSPKSAYFADIHVSSLCEFKDLKKEFQSVLDYIYFLQISYILKIITKNAR